MSTIFDLLYREYCRACLAKMRGQLLIPLASDEAMEAPLVADGPASPGDRRYSWGDGTATRQAPIVR